MIHDEVRQGIFRGFKFKMKALILIAEKEVIAWCEIKKNLILHEICMNLNLNLKKDLLSSQVC